MIITSCKTQARLVWNSGSMQLCVVAMAECVECSIANRGECDGASKLTATFTFVQEDTISSFVYKVELRQVKANSPVLTIQVGTGLRSSSFR